MSRQLPTELLCEIIQHVPSTQDLVALCRVSKLSHNLAVPALYRDVAFVTDDSYPSNVNSFLEPHEYNWSSSSIFAFFETLERAPYLQKHVISFAVRFYPITSDASPERYGESSTTGSSPSHLPH